MDIISINYTRSKGTKLVKKHEIKIIHVGMAGRTILHLESTSGVAEGKLYGSHCHKSHTTKSARNTGIWAH
ncbi:hypothetical protein XELAEV_18004115mg [Xenopus laevis]|uniref:Uncharacterized protein n=1 Tax=Xenopus laevis TaxID=8355 RepID=A0A974BNR3_XENLA|nr:hypothetical protein XELAEV_18004115mg [Xenopus laevis]